MKLQSKYFIDNKGVDYKFAWFPIQLGILDDRGNCKEPTGRIWLEWYKEEWIMRSGVLEIYKQKTRRFQ